MTTMAYHLAANPEWQERLRDEGDRLIGDGPLDIDTLDKLETFDLVINECLRMVTPAAVQRPPRGPRHLNPGALHPHAGTNINLWPGMNHMLPELWGRPEKFDPDRFAPPRSGSKRHRYAFAPFGGAHKCIGLVFGQLEIKVRDAPRAAQLPPGTPTPRLHAALRLRRHADPSRRHEHRAAAAALTRVRARFADARQPGRPSGQGQEELFEFGLGHRRDAIGTLAQHALPQAGRDDFGNPRGPVPGTPRRAGSRRPALAPCSIIEMTPASWPCARRSRFRTSVIAVSSPTGFLLRRRPQWYPQGYRTRVDENLAQRAPRVTAHMNAMPPAIAATTMATAAPSQILASWARTRVAIARTNQPNALRNVGGLDHGGQPPADQTADHSRGGHHARQFPVDRLSGQVAGQPGERLHRDHYQQVPHRDRHRQPAEQRQCRHRRNPPAGARKPLMTPTVAPCSRILATGSVPGIHRRRRGARATWPRRRQS